MIDIDRDHRLRQAIELQQAQLRLYTDNIPDAVAYLDRERRIIFANRHFAEQRGTTADAIVGQDDLGAAGHRRGQWIAERTQRVFDRGETATYERVVESPGAALLPREGGARLRRVGRRARHVRRRPRHHRGEGGRGAARRARAGPALLRREHSRGDRLHRPRARLHLREQRLPRHARVHARIALGKFPAEVYPRR
jgi:PAS domain S-box-containing protein